MKPDVYKHELTPVLYEGLPVNLLYTKTESGQFSPSVHWHERFEILVMDEGTLHMTVISPSFIHEGVAGDEGVSYRVLAFELVDQFAKEPVSAAALKPLLDGTASFAPLVKGDVVLRQLTEDICEECEHRSSGCELRLLGLVYLLLARLCESHMENRVVDHFSGRRLQTVTKWLAEHYCEPITISELSAHFGYEEAYFCRLFKKSIGLRPVEYIRIMRLEKARRLLKNTDDTISSIAGECGFSDSNYFARCFKQHYGMGAGDYRRHNRFSDVLDPQ